VEHNARSAFRVVNGFGTLLGPEETPCRLVGVFLVPLPALDRLTHPVARACVARACVGVVVVVGVGVWWCVECCIVDASIFFVSGFVVCACLLCVKCCRAQGGCLGIRSR
jgi:hypothetical protein